MCSTGLTFTTNNATFGHSEDFSLCFWLGLCTKNVRIRIVKALFKWWNRQFPFFVWFIHQQRAPIYYGFTVPRWITQAISYQINSSQDTTILHIHKTLQFNGATHSISIRFENASLSCERYVNVMNLFYPFRSCTASAPVSQFKCLHVVKLLFPHKRFSFRFDWYFLNLIIKICILLSLQIICSNCVFSGAKVAMTLEK